MTYQKLRGPYPDTALEMARRLNIVAHEDHWERQGIVTGEDLAKAMIAAQYSDDFKSLYGVRSGLNWRKMSAEAMLDELDDLHNSWDDAADMHYENRTIRITREKLAEIIQEELHRATR